MSNYDLSLHVFDLTLLSETTTATAQWGWDTNPVVYTETWTIKSKICLGGGICALLPLLHIQLFRAFREIHIWCQWKQCTCVEDWGSPHTASLCRQEQRLLYHRKMRNDKIELRTTPILFLPSQCQGNVWNLFQYYTCYVIWLVGTEAASLISSQCICISVSHFQHCREKWNVSMRINSR